MVQVYIEYICLNHTGLIFQSDSFKDTEIFNFVSEEYYLTFNLIYEAIN